MPYSVDPDIKFQTHLDNGKPALMLLGGGDKRNDVWAHWFNTPNAEAWVGISFSIN
jgi:hypothetical protein